MGAVLFERDGTLSGSIGGTAKQVYNVRPGTSYSSGTATCDWGSVSCDAMRLADNPDTGALRAGWVLQATALGQSVSAQRIIVEQLSTTDPFDFSETGTFSISCTLQFCIEDGPTNAPSPSSGVTPDAPIQSGRNNYWRIKPDTVVTATIAVGGPPVTATTSSPLTVEYPVTDGCNISASNTSFGDGYDGSISGTATTSFASSLGATVSDSVNYSGSYVNNVATSNAGGTSCSATATRGNDGYPRTTATASLSAAVPRAYTLNVKLARMSGVETASHNLIWYKGAGEVQTVTASGGAWSGSHTQYSYGLTAGGSWGDRDFDLGGGNATPKNKNTFGPISVVLANTPMVGGAAVDNTLIPLLDLQMPGLTLALPTSRTLPAGVDTTIGGGGGVSRSWASETNGRVYLTPYRYLAVQVKATGANVAFSVKIGGKTWTKDRDGSALQTGAADTYAVYTIDLCLPDNAADVDGQNTMYPLALDPGAISNVAAETSAGQYREGVGSTRGIIQATELRVEGSGCVLGTATLTRTNAPRLTTLWPFKAWQTQRPATVVAEVGTTTTHSAMPMLWAEVDGHPALEEAGQYWESTSGGGTGTTTWIFPAPSIADVAGLANHVSRGGWAAAINAPANSGNTGLQQLAHDDYYNRDRPAWGLGGASGWTHTGAGGWVPHIEQDSGVLPWQGSFTQIVCPGNVGDILGHGTATPTSPPTGALVLNAVHVFGMSGYGIAYRQDRQPVTSAIELTQSGDVKGSDTPDSIGAYNTAAPYGDGGVSSRLQSVDGGPFLGFTSVTRLRQWGGLRVVVFVPARGVDNLSNPYWGYYALARGTDAGIMFQRTASGSPDRPGRLLPPVMVAAGETLSNPALSLDPSGRLRLRWDDGAGTYESVSDNEGGTWGAAVVAIPGTIQPRLKRGTVGANEVLFGFAIAPDADPATTGTLKRQIVRAGAGAGGTTSAGSEPVVVCKENNGGTLTDLKLEQSGYAIEQEYAGAARHILEATAAGETDPSRWISGDNGATWFKVQN